MGRQYLLGQSIYCTSNRKPIQTNSGYTDIKRLTNHFLVDPALLVIEDWLLCDLWM